MKYQQCELVKDLSDGIIVGSSTLISWIPAKYAIKNKVLKLKKPDGSWEDGWKVSEIYGECDEKSLPDAHKMVKCHRKNTGDSLPK